VKKRLRDTGQLSTTRSTDEGGASVRARYNEDMRAPILVACVLAFALTGCKGKRQEAPPETTNVAPPATSVAPEGNALADRVEGAASADSFFDPDTDGRAVVIVRKDSPNMRYAQLGRDACVAELARRGIAFEEAPPTDWARRSRMPVARIDKGTKKAKPATKPRHAAGAKQAKAAKGVKSTMPPKPTRDGSATATAEANASTSVLAPVRIRGPVHGIAIHSGLPEKIRAKSTVEIFDCRLVLALDDFGSVLEKHGIVEVVHMSAFRSQRDRGCTPKYTGKQHCGALAVDVGTFKKNDGSVLDVDKDFNGRIGTATCTSGTGPNPVTPAATELWDIVCDSARRGLFHVMLTPNFNAEHKNHLHLEITPDVGWMLIK
jgi:hypothetical protein